AAAAAATEPRMVSLFRFVVATPPLVWYCYTRFTESSKKPLGEEKKNSLCFFPHAVIAATAHSYCYTVTAFEP
ncbi:hypothetical protein, partial [Acinetobacter baumannii]|uniref:hypothetical protein n=1 Tax=Acinetobacter baumannii TaxID=470 RepID=UPI001C07EBFA